MNYKQLIYYQRYQIESCLKENYSITRISIELGVHVENLNIIVKHEVLTTIRKRKVILTFFY